jgi:uncharacterized protein YndB with AHSA1/START domain
LAGIVSWEAIVDYELSTTIDASPEYVWTVLTDIERWPQWTASMKSLTFVGSDRLACQY